jgi:hypothetical protein
MSYQRGTFVRKHSSGYNVEQRWMMEIPAQHKGAFFNLDTAAAMHIAGIHTHTRYGPTMIHGCAVMDIV